MINVSVSLISVSSDIRYTMVLIVSLWNRVGIACGVDDIPEGVENERE